jgi:hypothetical protein
MRSLGSAQASDDDVLHCAYTNCWRRCIGKGDGLDLIDAYVLASWAGAPTAGGLRVVMDLIILSSELTLHFYASVMISSQGLERCF